MQKPIRYYITTGDEEPTVRSVRVAVPASQQLDHGNPSTTPSKEVTVVQRRFAPARVRRLVEGAIVKGARRG